MRLGAQGTEARRLGAHWHIAPAAAALTLLASPARAHGDLPGAGGVVSGVLHPFAATEHLLLLLALGLLAGRLPPERRGPVFGAAALGLLFGLGLGALAPGAVPPRALTAVILAMGLLAGLLLALASPLPRLALPTFAGIATVVVALDTDVARGAGTVPVSVGLGIGVALVVLDAAALAAWASGAHRSPIGPIALRVAGSWVAAAALMLLALAVARPGAAA